jgi:hypothetical protein
VQAFYQFALPFLGWSLGGIPGGCEYGVPSIAGSTTTTWRKGSNMFMVTTAPSFDFTNGTTWQYQSCIASA